MKKYFWILLLIFVFFSCKSADDDSNNNGTENNDSSAKVEKTIVSFENKTDFYVKVFADSLRKQTLSEIDIDKSSKIDCDYIKTGNVFYYTYYFSVNGIQMPYGSGESVVSLSEKNETKVNIPSPAVVFTNKAVVLLENASEINSIYIKNALTELVPENYGSSLIPIGKTGVYIIDILSISDLKNYKIVDGSESVMIFDDNDSISVGNIYSVRYDEKKCKLISVSPFNYDIQKKIWKMNLSQKTGKCLNSDKFDARENASDGYFFTGQISYDEELRNQESKPYKANISPSGEVTDSIVSLTGSPKMVASDCFVEKNGKRIVAGLLANSDGNAEPFIYGDVGCDFYIIPKIENFDSVVKLIHKDENVYSLLYWTIDKETKNEGFGIYEITLDSFDKAEGKCVYATNLTDSDYIPEDFIYHDKEYAVMVQKDTSGDDTGDETLFMFIDTENYEVKSEKQKKFEKYLFNGFEKSNDGKYAVASGSYKSAITGKDMAAFIKLDLTTGEFKNNGEPLLFKPREASLNSNFSCLSIKNNTLFLAGFIDCVYDNSPENYSSGYPYIVSYDLEKEKKNWTQIYEDYEGFQIYSCHLSAIGTPLIELYNGNTKKSILASCGLLGEIPDNELNPLPRNPKITEVSAPVFDIILTDPEENEFKMAFAYNSSITLDMINSNLSKEFIIPDGKDILGWQVEVEDKSGNISRKNVDFPLTVTESITLYPVFMTLWISGSSGSGYYDDDGFWMDCPISELNGNSVLRLCFKAEVQAFDRNYGKFVDDIGSWSVGTVRYALNDKYEEIPIKAPTSLKLGEEFYIDISLSDKRIVDANKSVSSGLLQFSLGAWCGCSLRAYLF